MKINFSVEEFKEMIDSGESDDMFFETLDKLGLDIKDEYYKSKENIYDIKKKYSTNSGASFYKNLETVKVDKKTLNYDLQNYVA